MPLLHILPCISQARVTGVGSTVSRVGIVPGADCFSVDLSLPRVLDTGLEVVYRGLDESHQPEANEQERGLYEDDKPGLFEVSRGCSPFLGHVSLAYAGSPYKWVRNEVMNPGYCLGSLEIRVVGPPTSSGGLHATLYIQRSFSFRLGKTVWRQLVM